MKELGVVDDVVKLSTETDQAQDRRVAYELAERYIDQRAKSGGVLAPVSKTFQDPQRKDPKSRIDIEVISGRAFVH